MVAQSFLMKHGARSKILGSAASLAFAFPIAADSDDPLAHTAAERMGWFADRTFGSEHIGQVVLGNEVSRHFADRLEVVPTTAGTAGALDNALVVRGTVGIAKDLYIGDIAAASGRSLFLLNSSNSAGMALSSTELRIGNVGGSAPNNIEIAGTAGTSRYVTIDGTDITFENSPVVLKEIDFDVRKIGMASSALFYDSGLDEIQVDSESFFLKKVRIGNASTQGKLHIVSQEGSGFGFILSENTNPATQRSLQISIVKSFFTSIGSFSSPDIISIRNNSANTGVEFNNNKITFNQNREPVNIVFNKNSALSGKWLEYNDSDDVAILIGRYSFNLANPGGFTWLRYDPDVGDFFLNAPADITFSRVSNNLQDWLRYEDLPDNKLITQANVFMTENVSAQKGIVKSGIKSVNGGGGTPDFTANGEHSFFYLKASNFPLEFYLDASPTTGRVYHIKSIDSTFTVTIDGNGKNIEGSASITLATDEAITVQYDGTEWFIF